MSETENDRVACEEHGLLLEEDESSFAESSDPWNLELALLAASVTPKFLRVIRLGTVGEDVLFAKRCLARFGIGELKGITRLQGLFGVKNVKIFQKLKGLRVDGQIGPATFTALAKYADERALWHLENARKKLTEPKPVPIVYGSVRLPEYFRMTHQTGGLPGYPAIDVFGKPYETVCAPENMIITRLSGKSPSLGGKPGGAYAWTMYSKGDSGAKYFLTHFAYRSVVVGQRVIKGQKIGAMQSPTIAGMSSSLTHIHEGKNS